MGAPPRVARLVQRAVHGGCDNPAAIPGLRRELAGRLAQRARVCAPRAEREQRAADGTRKWLVRTGAGLLVETVLLDDGGRRTLCLSSQAGCALGCDFCSTGRMGLSGNLGTADIVGQLRLVRGILAREGDGGRIGNVVFMGMGEPLHNFDAVVAAIQLFVDDYGYGLSRRRVTLSTLGLVPQLRRLAEHAHPALAVSLHAPDDALRNRLVPINRKYPIAMLLDAVRHYLAQLPSARRHVMIEYCLMHGCNDSPQQATALAGLLRGLACKINLIPFNPFPGAGYARPPSWAVGRFAARLRNGGFTATIRTTRGGRIDAACGQLAGAIPLIKAAL